MSSLPRQPGLTEHHAALREVGARAGLWSLLNPAAMAVTLWERRSLLWQFAKRDVVARNRGSVLGVFWTLLQPLVMLAVYTFVFAIVWEAKWDGAPALDGKGGEVAEKATFALSLFAGLLLFEVFASTVNAAPLMIVHNPGFVKRVVFPLEVLPLSSLVASVVLFGAGLVILLVANGLARGVVSHTLWALPVVVLPLALLAGGLAMLVAALGVFLRDIRQVVQVCVQVLFFMTPILYPASKLDRAPAWAREVLALNPLGPVFESARSVMVFGLSPDWRGLAIATMLGVVVFQLGYAFFAKSKRGFADVL